MEFSVAKEEDIDEVLEYYNELENENFKLSRIRRCDYQIVESWINNEFINCYLLRENGELVSIVKSSRARGDQSHSSYLNISTRQKNRNMGYAKENIRYAIGELKKEKLKIVRVKIFSWNKPAIITIEKSGFTLSGRIVMSHYDEDFGDYIDDLLYHKFL